jgi:hypothetical protein
LIKPEKLLAFSGQKRGYFLQEEEAQEGGGFSFVHLQQDSDILRALARKLRDITGTFYCQ